MRARNIKPGFFTDSKIGRLTDSEKILFIGLWCLADRDGYFRNDPVEIKAKVFPYSKSVNISKMICNIMSLHLITLHDIHGFIPNFALHQRPHPHEAKSDVSDEAKNILKNQCNKMSRHVSKCPSDIMNDDVMNDDIKNVKDNSDADPTLVLSYSESFERLWKAYPIKKCKPKAFTEFKKAKIDTAELGKIIATLEAQIYQRDEKVKQGKWMPEFPYLERWIKYKRWTDETEKADGEFKSDDQRKKEQADYVAKRKKEMEV